MKKILFLAIAVFLSVYVFADVHPAKIFSDSMVLQRNIAIPVWGWADKGEKISIQFNKQNKTVVTDTDGKWRINLNAEKEGGPYQLVISGKNTLSFKNVLIGDVWICSGQSNMDFTVKEAANSEEEIASAHFPMIRHTKIPVAASYHPRTDLDTSYGWQAVTPGNIASFTAVGYFFAKKLYEEAGVPIGLINCTWRGSNVETWTSRQAMQNSEEFKELMAELPPSGDDSITVQDKNTLAQIQKIKDLLPEPEGGWLFWTEMMQRENGIGVNGYPSLAFNAMINPLIPYAVKGVIWYQGEENAVRAFQYRTAFPLLISDWRKQWKQGDLPFYFVQLSSFNARDGNSNNGSSWAELREAQALTLSLPNTGMAVTTDIGDATDIHPANKQEVGKRLAAIALHDVYGKTNMYRGPVYDSIKWEGDLAMLSFNNSGSGLFTKDPKGILRGFEIAGADKVFYPAVAVIHQNRVVISRSGRTPPIHIRYAWADDACNANLFNKEGFPAESFRTDQWQGITELTKYGIAGR